MPATRAAPRSMPTAAAASSRRSERVAVAEPATVPYCPQGPRATEAKRARAAPPPVTAATAAALLSRDKTGTHSGRTTSHVDALASDHAAAVLHRRLAPHVGLDRIKKLVAKIADAPASLAKAGHTQCDDCVTANAKRLSHKGKLYKPSHCGRLLHMDIVGPFTASHVHGFKWILVVVDDHSRYKFVKLVKNKSDAYEKVDELLATMDSMAATRGGPVKVVNIKCARQRG